MDLGSFRNFRSFRKLSHGLSVWHLFSSSNWICYFLLLVLWLWQFFLSRYLKFTTHLTVLCIILNNTVCHRIRKTKRDVYCWPPSIIYSGNRDSFDKYLNPKTKPLQSSLIKLSLSKYMKCPKISSIKIFTYLSDTFFSSVETMIQPTLT